MVETANPTTAQISARPVRRTGGSASMTNAASTDPISSAGGEEAVAARPDLQDVGGVDRQQRGGATEQHREHVERHAAEHDRLVPDVAEALGDGGDADAPARRGGVERVHARHGEQRRDHQRGMEGVGQHDAAVRDGEPHQHRAAHERSHLDRRVERHRDREHACARPAGAVARRAPGFRRPPRRPRSSPRRRGRPGSAGGRSSRSRARIEHAIGTSWNSITNRLRS